MSDRVKYNQLYRIKRRDIYVDTLSRLKPKEKNPSNSTWNKKELLHHRSTSWQEIATKINPNCPPDRRWKLRTINTSFAAFLIAPLCGRTVWISSWKIIHRRGAALPWVSRSEKYRGTKRQLSCCVMHVSQWALTAEFVPRRRRFLLVEDTGLEVERTQERYYISITMDREGGWMTRAFVNFSQHVSCPRRWVCESKIFEQRERDIIVSISLKSRKIDFPFATYAHGSIRSLI